MRITDVSTVLLTGPCTEDPFIAPYRRLRSAAFIEIHTDSGHVGLGETYAGYFVPEVVPEMVEFFRPILVGVDLAEVDIHTLCQRMTRSSVFWARVGLGSVVLSGIEAALWDLKGKMLGLPVYELLGGRHHERLLAFATGGSSPYPQQRLLDKVDLYLGLGFRAFKVGTGYRDLEQRRAVLPASNGQAVEWEVEKAELLRRHVGDEVEIMFDGHMGFQPLGQAWDLATAINALKALEPYHLFFFEEPLPYTDPFAYAELCRSTQVPVAGGEQLTNLAEFQQYAACNAFDIAQPDAAFSGGLSEFVRIGALFAGHNRRVAAHAWGAGAAVMQNIHAGFATPNLAILEIPPAAGELHTAIWGDSFQMENGYVLPPQAPGLGIELTESIKAKYPFIRGSGEFVEVPGKKMME